MTDIQSGGRRPYSIILVGAVLGMSTIFLGASPTLAVSIAGAFLLLGALLRMVMSEAKAGWLAVRGKTTDVVTLGLIGVTLMAGGLLLLVPRHWII